MNYENMFFKHSLKHAYPDNKYILNIYYNTKNNTYYY